ncbi:hypothetical protein ACIQ7D_25285 [Streptomyces sp. NPDC096310]
MYGPPGWRVAVGDLRFNVYTHRNAPAGAAEPCSYDLKWTTPPA